MKRTAEQLQRLRRKFWWVLGLAIAIWVVGGLLFGFAMTGGSPGVSSEALRSASIAGSVVGMLSLVAAPISIIGIITTSILVALRRRQEAPKDNG